MSIEIDIDVEPSDGVKALKDVAKAENEVAQASSKVNKEQEKAERSSKRWEAAANGLSKVFRTGVGALAGLFAKAAFDTFQHVKASDALAKSLGTTAQKAQQLAIAEKESGLASGSVKDAILATAEAQGRNATELKRLGFSYDEIKTADPVDLFDQITEKLSSGEVTAREYNAALKLFGGNKELVRSLSGEFSELQKQALESGKVIEEDTFEKMADGSKNLIEAIKDLTSNVTENLVSAFQYLGNVAGDVFNQMAEGIDLVQGAIVYLTNLGGGLLGGLSVKEAKDFAKSEGNEFLNRQSERRKARLDAKDSRVSEVDASRSLGEQEKQDELAAALGAKAQVDSLARVGLFAGQGQNESIRIQRQSVKLLKDIKVNTGNTEKAVKEEL